ncbi:Ion channel protein [Comamonas serinivorans]|uniref:Ion channel protein n=1 Tax=Comamonas serinivorans TaxID=1082851 RepID=A0A1Y0EI73_9BURK|nr:Ion channel protein [Comamonas serinivorans]
MWVCGLLLGLLSGWASAQPAEPGPVAEAVQNTQAVSRELDRIRAALDDAESLETLKSMSDKALAAQRKADAAVTVLMPQLDQIDARVQQLGPVDKDAVEGADIAEQRKALARERSEVDSAIKSGKLLAVEARQLSESIEQLRSRQFNAQILQKSASPLWPTLWRDLAAHVPADWLRLQALLRQGREAFDRAVAERGWRVPALGGVLALVLLFPLRLGLRRLGRWFAASDRAPEGRLRRSGLAVWLLVVGTSMPLLASWVWVESLAWVDAIAPRLEGVARQFIIATGVAAFITALSACLLVPKRPSWRLLNMDDQAATRLRKYTWAAAALVWLHVLVQALNTAARSSDVSTVALSGVMGLSYVGLLMAALFTLSRLRARQSAEAAGVTGSAWLMLAWLGGHLAVWTALVAALLGYLNFTLFAASQMVWMTVVVMATSLWMKFADDFFLWLTSPQSRSGQALRQAASATDSGVEQVGVLLSAVARLALLVLAAAAILAPFGNVNALFGWMGTLGQGVTIGGAVLQPGAIARALVVLLIGLALFKVLQAWLVDTYLPKTRFDLGARNSISTVARYLGITLTVIWTLAALGIGFEKIALLASALSVGIGFGLQAITQNFVSGLILLAERPVKLGDRITIGDQAGDVRRISVRATEIQLDDRSTLIVPNSELITKSVRNMTMGNVLGRIQIKFTVPLSTDVQQLKTLLLELYGAHEAVLDAPAPSVYIDAIGDGLITINSFAHVNSPRSVYATRSDLLFSVLERLQQAGIPLSTPTDIHVILDPQADPGLTAAAADPAATAAPAAAGPPAGPR